MGITITPGPRRREVARAMSRAPKVDEDRIGETGEAASATPPVLPPTPTAPVLPPLAGSESVQSATASPTGVGVGVPGGAWIDADDSGGVRGDAGGVSPEAGAKVVTGGAFIASDVITSFITSAGGDITTLGGFITGGGACPSA